MKTNATSEVIARSYVVENGQQTQELIRVASGAYFIAKNGTIEDARPFAALTQAEAREWYDGAAYQLADRP